MFECLVIGAGLSGLTAALRLQQTGVDVHVLEREQRVGGRVRSSTWSHQHPVNEGAQFLLGRPDDETAVMRLARELGIETHPYPDAPITSYEAGRWIVGATPAEFDTKQGWSTLARLSLRFTNWRLNRLAQALIREAQGNGSKPVQDRLDSMSFAQVLGQPHQKVRGHVEFTLSDLVSHPPEGVSAAQGVLCVERMNSMVMCLAEGGISAISDELSRRLVNPVTLGVDVLKVENRTDHVEVSARQDGVEQVMCARRVVLSVPCDIARNMVVELPDHKRDAFSYVSYGPYLTCSFLTTESDERHWDRYTNVLVHGVPTFGAVLHQSFRQRQSETRRGAGSALLTFAASDIAQRLLPLTADEIAAATRADLLKLYPDLTDHIAEIRVNKWPRGIPAMRPGAYSRLEHLRSAFGRIHFCGDYLTYGPADISSAIESAEAMVIDMTRESCA